MSSVTLSGLVKRFGQTEVVRGVDLEIAPGELVVLLGPSGCGKTTTLRMIAGFVEPSAGEIRIGPQVVNKVPPRRRNLGMVFQDYALFPNMTVAENVGFGLAERRVPAGEAAARRDEMLRIVQMDHLGHRYPAELSGGQQQRVALARALAYQPGVLLMDEPLGALDQKLREDMQREFARIQRQLGITTVFVTHDQSEAMMLADRIVVMNGGRIEQAGRAEDLYAEPRTLFIADFIGRSNKLAGTLEARYGEEASVRLETGASIRARAATGVGPGAAVTCVVRPENLRIGNDAAPNRLTGRVLRRSFLGDSVEVGIELEDSSEIVLKLGRAEPAASPENGVVTIGFEPRDTLCFARNAALSWT